MTGLPVCVYLVGLLALVWQLPPSFPCLFRSFSIANCKRRVMGGCSEITVCGHNMWGDNRTQKRFVACMWLWYDIHPQVPVWQWTNLRTEQAAVLNWDITLFEQSTCSQKMSPSLHQYEHAIPRTQVILLNPSRTHKNSKSCQSMWRMKLVGHFDLEYFDFEHPLKPIIALHALKQITTAVPDRPS